MKQILSFDIVKKLIEKGGFGTYRLYSTPGESLLAGSHLRADVSDDSAIPTAKLIAELEESLELVTEDRGKSTFLIELKRSPKTQSISVVKYMFTYGTGQEATQQQPAQFAGIGEDKLEALVANRVAQLLSVKEAEWEKQRQIDMLVNEIADLKRKRHAPKKKGNDLSGLIKLGLVGGSAFITKQWPDTKEIVKEALAAVSNMTDEGDEEEDEEEGTGFERPNS